MAAAIGITLFTAVASAHAFAGSQVTAQKLSGSETKYDVERHNKAMEAFNKAQQDYVQK